MEDLFWMALNKKTLGATERKYPAFFFKKKNIQSDEDAF